MSILVHGGGKKYPSNNLGGKGVQVVDIITFLESLQNIGIQSLPNPLIFPTSSVLSSTPSIRVTNGLSLALIYLEWLVGSNQSNQDTLDLYGQYLMKAIPINLNIDHTKNILTINENDSEEIKLYKLYRLKLQVFLQSPLSYRVERIMKFLPRVSYFFLFLFLFLIYLIIIIIIIIITIILLLI